MALPLWNRVLLRYSDKELRQLTNPDSQTSTTVDTTKGTNVSTDAEKWFKRRVGVAYSDDDSDHHDVAILATYVLLREYAGKSTQSVKDDRERCLSEMNALRKRTHNKRVTSRTTHRGVIPTDEDKANVVDRPYFDSERFNRVTPNDPKTPS